MKKALVIVDVQRGYKDYIGEDYLLRLEEFLDKHSEHYDKIYVFNDIFDKNMVKNEYIPKFLSKYKQVFKFYSKDYSNYYINNDIQLSLLKRIEKIKDGYVLLGYDNRSPYYEFIDNSFMEIIDELSEFTSINLVGGIDNKCIKKTELIFKTALPDVNIMRLNDLCFNSNKVNDNSSKLFNHKISCTNKYIHNYWRNAE